MKEFTILGETEHSCRGFSLTINGMCSSTHIWGGQFQLYNVLERQNPISIGEGVWTHPMSSHHPLSNRCSSSVILTVMTLSHQTNLTNPIKRLLIKIHES